MARGRRLARGLAIPAAVAAALMLLAATQAAAAVRFAAPGGTGSAPCASEQNPCSLFTAASSEAAPSPAQPGDEVVLAPGKYAETDLGPSRLVNLPNGVDLHGASGKPRPRLTTTAVVAAIRVNENDTVSHLQIDSTGLRAIDVLGGVVEDVVAQLVGHTSGSFTCSQRGGLIRDSVCLNNGNGAVAIGTSFTPAPGTTTVSRLRNVTAVASGSESFGLDYVVLAGTKGNQPKFNVDAIGVIARGTKADVVARGLSTKPTEAETGAKVDIQLDHSDYATTVAQTDAGGGTATVSPTGAGTTNLEAAPLLDTDGFHQFPGSPTVDKGATDPLSGQFDIDGGQRIVGPAADIGADELPAPSATTLICSPTAVAVGHSTICAATVRDPSGEATAPAGKVDFTSAAGGVFDQGGSCELDPVGSDRSRCEAAYTPSQETEQLAIVASYSGDHGASGASATIDVGAVRFAAPGGTGSAPCANEADPCSLFDAASSTGEDPIAEPGDEIVLAPGTYSDSEEDLGPSGSVALAAGVYLHGEAGKPKPLIVLERNADLGALRVGADDTVSHLRIDSPIARTDIRVSGGVVEDVIARSSSAAAGTIVCFHAAGLIRDSACLSDGAHATALGVNLSPTSGRSLALRNVTAVSDGPESFGVNYRVDGQTNVDVDAVGVIARGTETDVVARALSAPPHTPGTGANVDLQLAHSAYATTLPATDAGGGTATISPTGAGTTNLTAAPQLLNDGVHQLPGSPTVDAGASDELSGAADIDLQPRVAGAASDIGADELAGKPTVTTLECAPAVLGVEELSTCTATVEDTSDTPTVPTGTVEFAHTNQGGFTPAFALSSGQGDFASAGASCGLDSGSEGKKASCTVTYRPEALGQHQLTATYTADETHAPSSGTFTVTTAPPTETRVVCAPPELSVGELTTCTATVRDTASQGPTSPEGTVSFSHDSQSQGEFPAGTTCDLTGTGPTTSCSVDYRPESIGTHTIEASYPGDSTHPGSSGTRLVEVESPIRFAAPNGTADGSTGEPCERTNPCSIYTAASSTAPGTSVKAGDHVVLLPGDYADTAGDLGPEGVEIKQGIRVNGAAGQPRPTIAMDTAGFGLRVNAGDELAHVEIHRSTPGFAVQAGKGIVDDVIARSTASGTTCSQAEGLYRDSVCLNSAPNGAALGAGLGKGDHFAKLRNVTAVSTGPESVAMRYGATGGDAAFHIDAASVIARGVRADVVAEGNSDAPHIPGTGGLVEIHLDHSDYATTDTDTDTGGGTATVSPTGPGTTNIKDLPQLAADGVHEQEGSPTVDAGATDALSGEFDIDGDKRRVGPSADIGADEFVPPVATETTLECEPPTVEAKKTTTCTATVEDISTSRPTSMPTGKVHFASDSPGAFSRGGECDLNDGGDDRTASCQLDYVPKAVQSGTHRLEAAYEGDATHPPSADSFALKVFEEGSGGGNKDTTETTISCEPGALEAGAASQCTATVRDTAPSGASAPLGKVHFETGDPGTFSPDECNLLIDPDGTSASCDVGVVYTPEIAQGGSHTLMAVYGGDDTHASSTGAFELGVFEEGAGGVHVTDTKISCDSPVKVREPSHCTAEVTDTRAVGASTPGGTVSFGHDAQSQGEFPGGASCTPTGAGATASCSVDYRPTAVGSGQHSVTASYGGDAEHEASTKSTTVTVQPDPALHATDTEISCDSPVKVREPSHCTAEVTDTNPTGTATPAGSVSFTRDAQSQGEFPGGATCNLAGAGPTASCSVDYKPIAVGAGTHTITASYSGDASHEASLKSTEVQVQVNPALHTTETEIACDSPVKVREPSHCTAEVTDTNSAGQGTPGGTVSFGHDSASQGEFPAGATCNLTGTGATTSCAVDYKPTAVGTGQHTITASYSGDNSHEASLKSTSLTVQPSGAQKHAAPATLECEPGNLTLGAAAVCTVTVEDNAESDPSAAEGEVQFASDGPGAFSANGACQLFAIGANQARCQLVYTPSQIGSSPTHTIKASYQGDSGHAKSNDSAQISVSAAGGGHSTATSVSCQPASVILGGASVCTANVEDVDPANPSAPGGGVLFASDSPGTFGSGGCLLFPVGSGESRCQVIYKPSELGGGTHKLTGLYTGDSGHKPSQRGTQVTVSTPPNGAHPTKTSLQCQPQNPPVGGDTICTVEVENTDGSQVSPHQAVFLASDHAGTFNPGGCILTDLGQGRSSCDVSFLPKEIGKHELTAVYGGDSGNAGVDPHEPSLGTTQLDVGPAPHQTETTLACVPAAREIGQPVACTATVEDSENPGSSHPGGEVKFQSDNNGGFSAASCALPAGTDGTASCQVTYTPKAAGNHQLKAAYQGDNGHLSSQGTARLQVAAPPPSPQPPPPGGSPQPPGAPAAPNTKIGKKPRKKTALRKAKFKFTSDQAGSSFQCKLDRKPFRPCRSPFKAKVKPGSHTFRVRAVNSAGIADPTPAVFRWKVSGAGARR